MVVPEIVGDVWASPDARPRVTAVNAEYFAAAARGRLVFQRCGAGHAFLYPRSLCPVCHSQELSWERGCGLGEVLSFAPVHRPPWDDVARPRPYVVVLVVLDEGPQLLSTVERVHVGDVTIGMRVRAVFERLDDDVGLVRFVPDDGAGSQSAGTPGGV